MHIATRSAYWLDSDALREVAGQAIQEALETINLICTGNINPKVSAKVSLWKLFERNGSY